jgi:transcriptional regulator with XRE-family HTH domain
VIAARKQAGVTQQRLAELLNKPQSYVSKYERKERRLDVIEFLAIAKVLELDPCNAIKEIDCIISKNTHKESQ